MKKNKLSWLGVVFWALSMVWLGGCQSTVISSENANKEVAPAVTEEGDTLEQEVKSLAPARVDVRGYINRRVYSEGQVTIFVEGTPGQGTLYDRAWVLVGPITQIIGSDGGRISLSELREGQQVAILLRGRGQQLNTFAGRGVASKVWVE